MNDDALDRIWAGVAARRGEAQQRPPDDRATPGEVQVVLKDPERTVDHYVLVEQIGRGGMGIVWRAWDRKLNRWVAFKTLKSEGGPGVLDRFRREAQAMARLRHPNLVAVHDVGGNDQKPYIVMEFVSGRPLEVAAPLAENVDRLRRVALGLDEAHRAGVVHRDLKPGNILVDAAGEPRVVDFGLAHVAESGPRLTRSGMALGTPLYMAPEQIAGRREAQGPRTDVYALGVILYESMTGKPPFYSQDVAEVYDRILRERPVPPAGPADLVTICLKAMEKDPGRRYVSAREFADDLSRYLSGRPVAAKPPGALDRSWQWLGRHRVVAGVLLGIGIAAAVGYPMLRHRSVAPVAPPGTDIEEKVRPHFLGLVEMRARFYNPNTDIEALLAEAEERLRFLERLVAKPEYAARPQGWAALGIGRYLVGDIAAAEPALAKAEKLGSTDGWMLYAFGRTLMQRSFEMAVPHGSMDSRHNLVRADLQARGARYIERAGQAWSGARPAELAAARAWLATFNKPDEAGAILLEELKTYGDKEGGEDLWMAYGFCPGTTEERVERISRALKIRPWYPWASFARAALTIVERKDFAAGERDLDISIRGNPRFPVAYGLRGYARRQRGAFGEAIDDYTRAIGLDPDYVAAWRERAMARARREDFAGATDDFNQALKLRPGDAISLDGRGSLRAREGDYEPAIADFTAALAGDPELASALFNRGVSLGALKRFREAAADFEAYLRLGTGDPAQLKEAEKFLREARRLMK